MELSSRKRICPYKDRWKEREATASFSIAINRENIIGINVFLGNVDYNEGNGVFVHHDIKESL